MIVAAALPLLFAAAFAGAFAPPLDMERLGLWAAQADLGAVEAPAPAPEAGGPAAVRAPRSLSLRGFSSSWIQDCTAGCGLPAGVKKNDPVDLTLALPDVPGEFRAAKFSRTYAFQTPGGGAQPPLQVAVSVYAVCPRGAPASAEDPCPGRYFQAQIELSGAAAAQCGASLNEADAAPFPVMTCGAFLSGKPLRVGVSLHRVPL